MTNHQYLLELPLSQRNPENKLAQTAVIFSRGRESISLRETDIPRSSRESFLMARVAVARILTKKMRVGGSVFKGFFFNSLAQASDQVEYLVNHLFQERPKERPDLETSDIIQLSESIEFQANSAITVYDRKRQMLVRYDPHTYYRHSKEVEDTIYRGLSGEQIAIEELNGLVPGEESLPSVIANRDISRTLVHLFTFLEEKRRREEPSLIPRDALIDDDFEWQPIATG